MSAVARALKIHTGERRVAVSLIALSFLVLAGQVIGQSAATALFFERVGTARAAHGLPGAGRELPPVDARHDRGRSAGPTSGGRSS